MRRKPKFRASYNPQCSMCVEGWRKIEHRNRFGRVTFTVERCECYRVSRVPDDPPRAKRRQRHLHDGKAAAGGES